MHLCACAPDSEKCIFLNPARRYVVSVDVNDQRCKPYMIAFESGEIHSYSRESAVKFRLHAMPTSQTDSELDTYDEL